MMDHVNKIECLLSAIGRLNGWQNPDSVCFSINNPLMTRSWARPGRHLITDDGIRIFPSILAGVKAGIFDLELKLKGQSRAGLRENDELRHLLGCYGIKEKAAIDNIVAFVRRGLKDQSVSASTPLSYFVEKVSTENGQQDA